MSLLRVEKLTRRYGALVAVDEVSIDVAAGERHAVVGPNGAGKSSLFDLLSGLARPAAGRILLDGQHVTAMGVTERARLGVSRTFQIVSIFPELTIAENLALAAQAPTGGRAGRRAAGARVGEMLETWGLADRRGVVARDLAYGEQRQLELALALAHTPRLLLLDEPAAGLSGEERERLLVILEGLGRELTILLVEHDIDLVMRFADVVTVMNLGAVLVSGPPEAVRADPRVLDVYVGRQLETP